MVENFLSIVISQHANDLSLEANHIKGQFLVFSKQSGEFIKLQ